MSGNGGEVPNVRLQLAVPSAAHAPEPGALPVGVSAHQHERTHLGRSGNAWTPDERATMVDRGGVTLVSGQPPDTRNSSNSASVGCRVVQFGCSC